MKGKTRIAGNRQLSVLERAEVQALVYSISGLHLLKKKKKKKKPNIAALCGYFRGLVNILMRAGS